MRAPNPDLEGRKDAREEVAMLKTQGFRRVSGGLERKALQQQELPQQRRVKEAGEDMEGP